MKQSLYVYIHVHVAHDLHTHTHTHTHTQTAAHTTQFTEIGYVYLKAGTGAGHLANGGSYVTLTKAGTKDFTIIIETMVYTKHPHISTSIYTVMYILHIIC